MMASTNINLGRSLTTIDQVFIALFLFRYVRLLVHLFAFWWLYKPSPVPQHPTVHPSDVTVVIPTVDPSHPWFLACLESVASNSPASILIVTVGRKMHDEINEIIEPLRRQFRNKPRFTVLSVNEANKRKQLAHAIPRVKTDIIALVDATVTWPSRRFLVTAIAPFEDSKVGIVGTNKRVVRLEHGPGWQGFKAGFYNFLGAVYLERHNFEIRATNAIDGGVFVISGRTSLHRSCILQDPAFLKSFTNEYCLGYGPILADDDNHITRWDVARGWKIKIQYCPDSLIETTVGDQKKFLDQCLRWVRTTWRSNSCALFTDRTVWRVQPWCVYAVYLSSLINFAALWDPLLVFTLSRTQMGSRANIIYLVIWIIASKVVKLTPYLLRHPADIIYLPGYMAFAYYHSKVKLHALLTFGSNAWPGRDLDAINAAVTKGRSRRARS